MVSWMLFLTSGPIGIPLGGPVHLLLEALGKEKGELRKTGARAIVWVTTMPRMMRIKGRTSKSEKGSKCYA
jgi:hypothetical protein